MKTNNPNNLDDSAIASMLKDAASAYHPPSQAKESVRTALMAEYAQPRQGRLTQGKLWTRFGKIAAAAAVVFAIASGFWWLLSGPATASSAYAELLQAIDNSKAAEWVYARAIVSGQEIEQWMSFRPFRQLTKTADRVTYRDEGTHRLYSYDPSTHTVTIEYTSSNSSLEHKDSFFEFMLAGIETFKDRETAEILKKQRTIAGKVYAVYTVNFTGQEPVGSLELTVDQLAKRVDSFKAQGGQLPEPVVVHFDYPDSGPADIYALGVPRDAKIIDQTPSKRLLELDKKIRAARNAFAPTYYAIICTASIKEQTGDYQPIGVHVIYKKSGKYRIEYYSGPITGDVPITDMKAMRAWIEQADAGTVRFFFTEPERTVVVRINKDGNMVKESDSSSLGQDNVESVSWGLYSSPRSLTLLPSEDEKEVSLIGVEHFWQGHVYKNKVANYPGRTRQYFDPDRDYIRARAETIWDAQADWQKDKDWLKDIAPDAATMSYKSSSVTKVVEYAQTVQGQWYAKKVIFKQNGARSGHSVRLVHLDTTREIPDELLDPSKITLETFAPKEQLFDWHFTRAIKILDSRKDWPSTPEEVAKLYWQARLAKNYDEMAVLWPGSALWHREVCKDEKPVKWVFGKACEGSRPDEALVPYAAQEYYKQHGTYNLKMLLTNKESVKGRYYILSGN